MTDDLGDLADMQGWLDRQARVTEQRYWTEQLLEEQGKTQRKFVVVQRRLTYLLFYWTALPLLLAWTFTTLLPLVGRKTGRWPSGLARGHGNTLPERIEHSSPVAGPVREQGFGTVNRAGPT